MLLLLLLFIHLLHPQLPGDKSTGTRRSSPPRATVEKNLGMDVKKLVIPFVAQIARSEGTHDDH